MKSYSHWGMFPVGYWVAEAEPGATKGRLVYVEAYDYYDSRYLHYR